MRALITGYHGTVGRALRAHLESRGDTPLPWDRLAAPVTDYHRMDAFVAEMAPDAIFHLAIASKPTGLHDEGYLVNVHWPNELAWIARTRGIPLVFTSTAMVFSDRAHGPFTTASEPDAAEGYGMEKRRAEERVRAQYPEARIVRLGWQIGDAPGSNNMIDFMEQQCLANGCVRASTRWLPACSFLADTAAALVAALGLPPGTHHADSNRTWTFAQIARALSRHHRDRWPVVETEDFVYDQRLLDDWLVLPPLEARLVELLDDSKAGV